MWVWAPLFHSFLFLLSTHSFWSRLRYPQRSWWRLSPNVLYNVSALQHSTNRIMYVQVTCSCCFFSSLVCSSFTSLHFVSDRKWAEERVHTRAPNKMRDADGGASIWCSAYVMDTTRHLAEAVGAHSANTHTSAHCISNLFYVWYFPHGSKLFFLFVVFSAFCAIVVRMHCKRCCCLSGQPTRPIHRNAIVCA